jgi:phospholipase/carboxylesterase
MQKKDLSLIHEIMPPQNPTEKAPLLLMLHGFGSHENDLFGMAQMLNKEFFIVSARAPLTLGFGGFAWYEINFDEAGSKMSNVEQAKDSLHKIEHFIDELVEAYPIDERDINLMGFSQGCILSYGLILNNPKRYRKVLALSGYILKDIIPTQFKKEELRDLDLFISHGTQDEVLPVDWARQSLKVFEQLNVAHKYQEYPMGHGVSPECFQDMKKWLTDRDLA